MADVKINTQSKANTKGIQEAEKSLQKLGTTAQQASQKASSATQKTNSTFSKLGQCIEKVSSTVGKFNAVFTGFSIVNVILNLVNTFKSLHDWLNKSKTKAEEAARAIQDAKNEAAIRKSTEAYKALNDEINKSIKAQQLKTQLAAQEKATREGTEDAQLALAEAQELAGIAVDDPDAAQKATLISNKYAAQRAELAKSRAWQNRVNAQEALYDSCDEKRRQADEKDKLAEAEYERGYDLSASRFRLFNPYATGRKSLSEMSEEERTHWNKLKEQEAEAATRQKTLEDEANALRESAAADEAQAQALNGSEDPAVLQADATLKRLSISNSQAQHQIEQNRKNREKEAAQKAKEEARKQKEAGIRAGQMAEDQATIQAERYSIAPREARVRDLEAQKKGLQGQLTKEQNDVIDAENALGSFEVLNQSNAPGYQSGRASLARNLERERAELKATEKSLGKALNAIESELQDLRKMITQSTNKINQASSRLNANLEAEAAGD